MSRFSMLLILISVAAPGMTLGDVPSAAPAQFSPLEEKKTATELPTKRKLPTAQPISPEVRSRDASIAERLNRIARSQDVFQRVRVTVKEGVVLVQGEVDEEAFAKSFTALCEKVEGVIGVVDQMRILNVKKTGLRLAESEVRDLYQKFFRFIPYLASCLLLLVLTVALTFGVFRLAYVLLSRRFARRPLIAKSLAKAAAFPVVLFGAYLVLQVGGLTGLAATVVGGTGVLGIVLGLAGKNIIENALSSFMLSMRKSFQIGDRVAIGPETGVVQGVDSRCTTIVTDDGILTQIPNSTVLGAVIRNYSASPAKAGVGTRPATLDQ